MEHSKNELYIALDDYAMQDDERDLDFSPGQKRSRRGVRKSNHGSTIPLSTSLPSTSGIYMPKGSEMKIRDDHNASAATRAQPSGNAPVPYVRLEKSRQSARECRARKKLRYQYLEEMVKQREKAVMALREDFSKYTEMYRLLEKGVYSPEIDKLLKEHADMTK
ncbi:cAMP-responsive element-binding protein-like 2 [Galendromus occidentalis]|uniref:cAMP-responsive element-binding protein-like 2 n=1 Tax=Galendromus occidentalis TaxID=34638 RepID=A0AAJ6VZ59_9ACAR|nr:cAMP-responsive element-binding protein-like 2 [Galendromus occidentalis]